MDTYFVLLEDAGQHIEIINEDELAKYKKKVL